MGKCGDPETLYGGGFIANTRQAAWQASVRADTTSGGHSGSVLGGIVAADGCPLSSTSLEARAGWATSNLLRLQHLVDGYCPDGVAHVILANR